MSTIWEFFSSLFWKEVLGISNECLVGRISRSVAKWNEDIKQERSNYFFVFFEGGGETEFSASLTLHTRMINSFPYNPSPDLPKRR